MGGPYDILPDEVQVEGDSSAYPVSAKMSFFLVVAGSLKSLF
jgi:hypothetical protein